MDQEFLAFNDSELGMLIPVFWAHRFSVIENRF